MSLALFPTARGLRLLRSVRALPITLPPPPVDDNQPVLATETGSPIVTENGVRIATESS
jgi:hypothetical protein